MTHQNNDTTLADVMKLLSEYGFEGFLDAMKILMNEAMKVERSQALQAEPYERNEQRLGYANGFKPKHVQTRMGPMKLDIPQTRGLEFYPKALERGVRSERALKCAIAEMYLKGVSTRKVSAIMEELCGFDVSSAQVSRVSQMLDDELSQWRHRPLNEMATPYLILDARYEKIRHTGSVISCAVLIAMGVREDGKRTILGTSVSLSEAEVNWREFLKSLQDRGLYGVKYIVSDDHKGILAALDARFSGVPWQRCQYHLQQNATHYVPKMEMKEEVGQGIRDVFQAPSKNEAELRLNLFLEAYKHRAPKLVEWAETNLSQ